MNKLQRDLIEDGGFYSIEKPPKTAVDIARRQWITSNSGIKAMLTPEFIDETFIAGWNAKPEIKWKKIDPNNLPKGMVAALGDNNPVDILIGRIKKDRKPYCEIPSTILWITATHYIPLEELLSLQKEQ